MTARRLAAVLVAGAVVLAGCGEDGPPAVAATVAGVDIPSDRIERLTAQWVDSQKRQAEAGGAAQDGPPDRKQTAKLVLGFVIRSAFLEHLATQMGIADTPTLLETLAPAEVPSDEFESAGWSRPDFEQALRDTRLAKAMSEQVFATVAVSDVELRQKYDRSADLFQQAWRADVRVAYFASADAARALQQRGLTGDAFDTAARELGAKQAGGIGSVTPATPLPAAVLGVVAGLPAGRTSDPVEGGGGYLIVVVDSREDRPAMTFEQAKPELVKVVEDERRQKLFYDWFNKRLAETEVDVASHYGKWDPASQLVS